MKHKRSWALLALSAVLFTLICAPGNSGAQSGNVWTKSGSLPAGSWSLASGSASLYALGSQGISSSTDGGATWLVCNRDARFMRVVTPLPGQQSATAIYAATGAGPRLSEDGCRTWKDLPTQDVAPSGGHIRWLAPYPNNPSVIYAGMDGLGGLYRSTDSGNKWQPASQGLPAGAWITSLTADPHKPESILVGMRYQGRNHPPSYIYRSGDGGLTWRSSSNGLYVMPNNGGYVNGLAWGGENLFASTVNDGLYISTDRGATWHTSVMPRRAGPTPMPPTIDSLNASLDGELILGTSEGAFHSLDGGKSWQSFGPEGTPGRRVTVAFDANTGRALLGSKDAIWSYTLQSGAVTLPPSTPAPSPTSIATPPPPPQLPTSTPVPPTAMPTKTPVPPTMTPTPVLGYKPSDPAQPGDPEVFTFFPETRHNLGHGFRDFWQANDSVAQFGYPISEEFAENGVSVQYFERARLEYRDGKVTLARLGAELTAGQFFRPIPFFPSEDTNVYFGGTGHSVGGSFLEFWRTNGREELLGLPLSESFKEDGTEYQWFERSRFEWHPNLPEGKRITLGNLGVEALKKKGWIP